LTARFESARLLAALIIVTAAGVGGALRVAALRRSVLRRRQVAAAGRSSGAGGTSATAAATATASAATAKAAATSATIPTPVCALIAATKILSATVAARRTAPIIARGILLRGIVVMAEILRGGGVGFRLAFLRLRVHVGMRGGLGVVMFFDGRLLVVIVEVFCVLHRLMFVLVMFVIAVRVV